jgi:SdpC family antimicrobial peptide
MKNKINLINKAKSIFALTIIFTLVTSSCKKDFTTNKTETTTKDVMSFEILDSAKVDGRELFKSLIFIDGMYTNRVPSFDNNNLSSINIFSTQSQINEYRSFQEKAMNFIDSTNPGYFAQFKASMFSGNPTIIFNELVTGKFKTKNYINKLLEPTGYDVEHFVETGLTDENMSLLQSNTACALVWFGLEFFVVADRAVLLDVHFWISEPQPYPYNPQYASQIPNDNNLVQAVIADIVNNFSLN